MKTVNAVTDGNGIVIPRSIHFWLWNIATLVVFVMTFPSLQSWRLIGTYRSSTSMHHNHHNHHNYHYQAGVPHQTYRYEAKNAQFVRGLLRTYPATCIVVYSAVPCKLVARLLRGSSSTDAFILPHQPHYHRLLLLRCSTTPLLLLYLENLH